jgi:hypothetical protein
MMTAAPTRTSLVSCSPPSRPLRAACGGGLRPVLTAAAGAALQESGRDGETGPSVELRNPQPIQVAGKDADYGLRATRLDAGFVIGPSVAVGMIAAQTAKLTPCWQPKSTGINTPDA